MSACVISLDKGKIAQDAELVSRDKAHTEQLKSFITGTVTDCNCLLMTWYRLRNTTPRRQWPGHCAQVGRVWGDRGRDEPCANLGNGFCRQTGRDRAALRVANWAATTTMMMLNETSYYK